MIILAPLLFLATSFVSDDATPVPLTPGDSSTIVLRFGGDLTLGGYYESGNGEGSSHGFEGFDLLARADVAMVNLENPITLRGRKISKPFNFRMPPKYNRVLTDAGIDIVSIANNHIFDYGKQGLFDTISYLDSIGIRHVGAGRTFEEAHAPVLLTLKGMRIGFLAYYGGSEAPGAGLITPGVARRELAGVTVDILKLKHELRADYIVVNLHWGTENDTRPDAAQRTFANALIDAGADAVIGHHPHVLQGIEVYKSGVIVYSLGNLLFGGNSRSTYETGVFEISLSPKERRYAFIPVKVTEWRVSRMSGADSVRIVDKVKRLSAEFPKTIFGR